MNPVEMQQRCPACGAAMVLRENRTNRSEFLGCARWPDCKETAPLPASVEMRRAGAKPLPGME